MKNQAALVSYLVNSQVLRGASIINAFKSIDRVDFIDPIYTEEAYEDHPLAIGYGQTISQPSTVAFMLELLQPKPGDKILDIGSGSGWTAALLAKCVGSTGYVYGLERIPELVEFGQKNLQKYNLNNAKIIQAQSGIIGLPSGEVFNKILVSAAADELPVELISQFTERLVIPIRDSIWSITKDNANNLEQQEYRGFSFVPLISRSAE